MLTPFYLLWCINQIYSGALRGVGKSTAPMLIMIGSFVAFRQLYLYVVANFIANEFVLIAMGFPAGWVLSAIITFVYYKVVGLKPKEKKAQLLAE
jgi:Na+-driven multidrug efflux pump